MIQRSCFNDFCTDAVVVFLNEQILASFSLFTIDLFKQTNNRFYSYLMRKYPFLYSVGIQTQNLLNKSLFPNQPDTFYSVGIEHSPVSLYSWSHVLQV